MKSRTRLVAIVVALAVVASVVGAFWYRRHTLDSSASDAAARFAGLVASGDDDELEQLWAMTAGESPGALRTAGEVLADAEERIEVLEVAEPTTVAEVPAAPYGVDLDEFVRVDVAYRLDGARGTWPLVLGRPEGQEAVDDWRVLDGSLGSIDWNQPDLTSTSLGANRYVSGVWQVRGTLRNGGSDEDVQPLYPAVYRAQGRLDPWYTSAEELVTVTPGDPVAPPDFTFDATTHTERAVARLVRRAFASCDSDAYTCPAFSLADDLGADIYTRRWWQGLVREPRVRVDGNRVLLRDGVARLSVRGGVREVRFEGEGGYLLDNQSYRPFLRSSDFDLREVL